jgi:hypothetical protein
MLNYQRVILKSRVLEVFHHACSEPHSLCIFSFRFPSKKRQGHCPRYTDIHLGMTQETIRKPSGICKCILISNLLVYTLVYLMSSYAIRFINHHQPGLISGLSIFTNHRICRLCRRAQPWYCYSSRRLEAMHWAPWWPLPQPTTRLDNCSKKQRWLTDLKTWY